MNDMVSIRRKFGDDEYLPINRLVYVTGESTETIIKDIKNSDIYGRMFNNEWYVNEGEVLGSLVNNVMERYLEKLTKADQAGKPLSMETLRGHYEEDLSWIKGRAAYALHLSDDKEALDQAKEILTIVLTDERLTNILPEDDAQALAEGQSECVSMTSQCEETKQNDCDSNFVIDRSRNSNPVFLIPMLIVANVQIYNYSDNVTSILAGIFSIVCITVYFRSRNNQFVEMNEDYLVLRPQPALPAKKLPWKEIESVEISDNFNRTIKISLRNSLPYKCHGWSLKKEDYERFIRVITKRISEVV